MAFKSDVTECNDKTHTFPCYNILSDVVRGQNVAIETIRKIFPFSQDIFLKNVFFLLHIRTQLLNRTDNFFRIFKHR